MENNLDLSKEGTVLAALKQRCHSKIKPNTNTAKKISISNKSIILVIIIAVLLFLDSFDYLFRVYTSVLRQIDKLDKQESIPSSCLSLFDVVDSNKAMFINNGFYFYL